MKNEKPRTIAVDVQDVKGKPRTIAVDVQDAKEKPRKVWGGTKS